MAQHLPAQKIIVTLAGHVSERAAERIAEIIEQMADVARAYVNDQPEGWRDAED